MAAPAPARIHTTSVSGTWFRLHNVNSSILASLLDLEEQRAVNRRLGLPGPEEVQWIPATSGPHGGRFVRPGGPGALYLGDALATCLAEVIHHQNLLFASAPSTPRGMHTSFRQLVFRVDGAMADAARHGRPLRHPIDYAPSWVFGAQVRAARLDGIRYTSVRATRGSCVAAFESGAARFDRVEYGAVVLEWDGSTVVRIG
jgi:hypothetical protein